MKTIIIVLSIACVLLATTGIVAATALYEKAKEPHYKIVRDTVYIDRGRSDCQPWYQYQVELGQDSNYVWSGQRLVAVMHYKNSNIDSVLIADNE